MSTTGYLARGLRCSDVMSVDFGLYSRIVGGGNSGSRPCPGRGRTCPGLGFGGCAATYASDSARTAAMTAIDVFMIGGGHVRCRCGGSWLMARGQVPTTATSHEPSSLKR